MSREARVLAFALAGALALGWLLWWWLSRFSAFSPALAIHAALMLVAWSLLLPAGSVLARYFKVMPGQDFPTVLDNKTWFNWHRIYQYVGLGLATAGLAAILSETHGSFESWHARCGILVLLLGWGQVVSTLFRGTHGGPTGRNAIRDDPATWRGDHYDMTRRRILFERYHKPVGWMTVLLAEVTVVLGLDLADAPAWLWASVGAVQALLAAAMIDCRFRGRWVHTYVALWGLESVHPGTAQRGRSPAWSKRRGDGSANRL